MIAKTTTPHPKDLTTAEVAEMRKITTQAVRGLIQRGHFPNVRKLPGRTGAYLIPCSDLEHYLVLCEARKRQKSASSPKKD